MSSLLLSPRDLQFLLFEWLDVMQLTARPRHAAQTREEFDAVLELCQQLAQEQFAPHNKLNDQQEPRLVSGKVVLNAAVEPALKAFFESGLAAATFDAAIGGLQLPQVVAKAGMAWLAAANVATSAYAYLTVGHASLLANYGSESQQQRFLPALLSGRFFGTMCLSEPQAGSSLADITTRAQLQPDGRYRLFGNKMWISGGDHELSDNIVHLVLAKIADADGRLPPGVQGISLFLVPKFIVDNSGACGARNDVTLAGLNHKMGYRGTTNCLLNFGEGRHLPEGAAGALGELVGKPGEGLACMFHMMNDARINVGLGAAALGYTGYLHALDYARTRRQGRPVASRTAASSPVPILAHADVRRMLLAQKAYAEGALALTLWCARLSDEQQTAELPATRDEARELLDLLTPVAKSWPSQWCVVANDLAIQVHGGYGYTRDYNVEQFYRDNRLNPIHEGTLGMQALDLLGRKLRSGDGAALRRLNQQIEATLTTALASELLADDATRLGDAHRLLTRVTLSLMGEPDVALRLANATPFLEAFGHVVVGWLWLDQACAAVRQLPQAESAEAGYYRGKLHACRYFMRWELPRVAAWLAVLEPIDPTCLQIPDTDW